MNFKIDLKPYPGAPYFTVDGHRKAYDKLRKKPDIDLQLIFSLLRKLFAVPQDFKIGFFDLRNKDMLLQDHSFMDVSYLFPQAVDEYSKCDAVLLDPNASLGVPAGFFMLFYNADSLKDLPQLTIVEGKECYILQKVLEDYQTKGLELLLRESNYKAAVLHQMIESSPMFESVGEKAKHSKTHIAARCSLETIVKLRAMGYEFGETVYTHDAVIVFANYPTHSKEMIEMLADRVAAL